MFYATLGLTTCTLKRTVVDTFETTLPIQHYITSHKYSYLTHDRSYTGPHI
jgi:hypothetical protein